MYLMPERENNVVQFSTQKIIFFSKSQPRASYSRNIHKISRIQASIFFENINSYKKDVLIECFVFHIRNIGRFQDIRQKWRWADFCGGARRSYEASWTDGVR